MSTASILVGSLILGKAVLITDMLPAINRFPDKPLAYNVAWKTPIYLLVATVILRANSSVAFPLHRQAQQADGQAGTDAANRCRSAKGAEMIATAHDDH